MITALAVAAAFTTVGGMLCFLVYCNKVLDAESARVENYPRDAR